MSDFLTSFMELTREAQKAGDQEVCTVKHTCTDCGVTDCHLNSGSDGFLAQGDDCLPAKLIVPGTRG